MNEITQRMGQLRNAIQMQTVRTRSAIERVARELGVHLPAPRRRTRGHCVCLEGETDKAGCDLQFACHQLSAAQQGIVRDALRDQPLLFHAFVANMWTDADHLAILERVDAYIEQTCDQQAAQARQLLEHPHD
jgi:hypothetical protein